MEKKRLTCYQIDILKEIVQGSIEAISYYKPQKTKNKFKIKNQLEKVMENKTPDETLKALRSLENDFHILILNPQLKFGPFIKKGGYIVNSEKVEGLYNSYLTGDY